MRTGACPPRSAPTTCWSRWDASQMAAQMVHLTLVSKKDSWFTDNNVGFALVYEYIFDSAKDCRRAHQ